MPIIIEVCPTAFFITAENEAYLLFKGNFCCGNGPQRKQRRNGGPFVVHCAAANDFSVADYTVKRRYGPTEARRDDIEVYQYSQGFGANADFRKPCVSVDIGADKPQRFGFREHLVQRQADTRAKRGAGLCRLLGAVDAHKALQRSG